MWQERGGKEKDGREEREEMGRKRKRDEDKRGGGREGMVAVMDSGDE